MSDAKPTSGWLWGPVPDLLFGCGLWYAFAFVGLCVVGASVRHGGGLVVLPYMALLFGTPHYGATLLRVYRSVEDRRAYRFFLVHATIALFAVMAVGVHQPLVGSLILTLYLTWSPWHYTGQNYGVAVMMLRKRGAGPTPGLKRLLYLSFFLSFLLTFLGQHSGSQGDHFVPLSYAGAGYGFLAIGFPEPWSDWAILAVGVVYVVVSFVAATGLVRASGWSACGPALVMMFSQSLWFSIPLAARHWAVAQQFEPLSRNWATYYFIWIAVAHCVQYLWVTAYYARNEGEQWSVSGYSVRALLAGSLIWVAPALVFAPDLLGRLSFDSGLAILVASTVNLHHFILDGVIWKLRDGRVARLLLRPRTDPSKRAIEPEGLPWRAALVWSLGALCAVQLFYGKFETGQAEKALQRRDVSAAASSLQRLSWIGLATADGHRLQGDLLAELGRFDQAEKNYTRSIELRPMANAWQSMGALHARQRDWEGAAEAYEHAIAAAPDQDILHYESGMIYLQMGRLEDARAAFQRAVALNPKRGISARMLEQVEDRLSGRR